MAQFDRAVMQAWEERLLEAREATARDAAARDAPGAGSARPGEQLLLSTEEALELISCSGRLQDLGKRLLDRFAPKPPLRV